MRLRIFSSSSKLNTDTRLPSVSLQHRYWPYVWFVQHPAVSLALLSLQINKFFKFSIHSPLCNHAGNKGPPPSTPPVDIFIFYFGAKKKKKGVGREEEFFFEKGVAQWESRKLCQIKKRLHRNKAAFTSILTLQPASYINSEKPISCLNSDSIVMTRISWFKV